MKIECVKSWLKSIKVVSENWVLFVWWLCVFLWQPCTVCLSIYQNQANQKIHKKRTVWSLYICHLNHWPFNHFILLLKGYVPNVMMDWKSQRMVESRDKQASRAIKELSTSLIQILKLIINRNLLSFLLIIQSLRRNDPHRRSFIRRLFESWKSSPISESAPARTSVIRDGSSV